MAKIIIVDLPVDMKISKEEMKKVFGGAPRTVTMYPNPLDNISQSGIIDPLDLVGINVPPVSGSTKACAETWGGTKVSAETWGGT